MRIVKTMKIPKNFSKKYLDDLIQRSLDEDAVENDITTNHLISPRTKAKAQIFVKENAVLCCDFLADRVFKTLDPKIKLTWHRKDAQSLRKGDVVVKIEGKLSSILKAERTALNFLGRFSGISTTTNQFVQKTKGTNAKILDTRKTTPTFRHLEKYAVLCGGGQNHRMDLSEMAMIKDNHREFLEKNLTLPEMVLKIRTKTKKPIQVEVDNLTQFRSVLDVVPDLILLDNMTCTQMRKAVKIRNEFLKGQKNSSILLEASGGIQLKRIPMIAETGVDRISVGALTHSFKNVDFSLEYMSVSKG